MDTTTSVSDESVPSVKISHSVVVNKCYYYELPDQTSSILGFMSYGDIIEVEQFNNEWGLISYPDPNTGEIKSAYIMMNEISTQ